MAEHIVLLQESGSKHKGHVNFANGKAEIIASSITTFLIKIEKKMSDLLVVDCGCTEVKTV